MTKIIIFSFLLLSLVLPEPVDCLATNYTSQLLVDLKTQGIEYKKAVDVSAFTDRQAFRCLFQSGFSTANIRAYLPSGNGSPDVNSINNIINAASEGMGIEIYMEPQPRSTKSATDQFMELYFSLKDKRIQLKAIWIKVTSPINWPNNQDANINFINKIILTAERYGLVVGIYTNWYDWQQITAGWDSWSRQRPIRLWYWNMLGSNKYAASSASFDDFRPFSGFTTPLIKQYAQNVPVCGLVLSLNVYPSDSITKAALKDSIVHTGSMGANITVGLLLWTSSMDAKLINIAERKTPQKITEL